MKNQYTVIAPQALDKNHDGRVSAGELASSTLLGAGFVALSLGSVGLFGFAVLWGGAPCLRLGLLIVALAGVVAGVSGAWRLLYAFYELPHTWRADDRRRAIEQAEYERDYRDCLQDQVGDRISQADVDAAVDLILSSYYAGKPWQRGKIRGVSDPRWNLANQALGKAGLRRGKQSHLEADSFEDAWRKYLEWRRRNRSWKTNEEGDLINA